ncbi:PAS domain S-box protein [Desulfonatronum thioautotrophicum]|uniref:PAS domain S-box protein n=1 Tax=Desulfonatronum thioautotrophicum TaxID=617001 RepID=UPI00069B23C0|nr:PAS domain S-box protein [Desulfonatronum thioautotrophicum]
MWTRDNGQRLKFYRALQNMTQDELASRIGISKQHLGEIERGVCNPSLDLLAKACEALCIAPVNLFVVRDTAVHDQTSGNHTTEQGSVFVTATGTWTIDLADGKTVWSRTLYRMLRLPPARKPSLKLFLTRLREQDAPAFLAFHQQLARGQTPPPLSILLRRDSDTVRTVHVQADMLAGTANADTGLACAVFMDVTEGAAYHRHVMDQQDNLREIVQEKTSALDTALQQAEMELRLRTTMEEEVRAQSEQLGQVLSAVPAIIYSFVPGFGGMEWHSPHLQQILGYSLRELQADPMLWNRSIHSDDHPIVQNAIDRAQRGEPIDVHYRIRTKSGEWRWLHDKALPAKAPDGQTVFSGVAVDVTERKLAEDNLQQLSREYETILNTTPSSIFLIGVEAGDRLVFERLNKREEELTGLCTETVRGKTPVEVLGPEAGLTVERNYRRCLEQKQIITYEETLSLPGGERTWLTQLTPLLAGGKVIKIVGSGLDISERKLAEEALRKSEVRFRTLIQSLPSIAVQGYGPDGTTLYWNQASERIYGYSEEEALGRNLLDLIIPPEMQDVVKEAIATMTASKEPIPAEELWLMRKDGSRVPVHSSHVVLPSTGQAPVLFCIDYDLTERKQAEVELRRARDIVENIQVGLFVYHQEDMDDDRSLRMVYANPVTEIMTGLDVAEIIGRTLDENYPSLRQAGIPRMLADVVRTGSVLTFEDVHYGDKRIRPSHFSVKAFALPGNHVGVSFENITRRKQAEEDLRKVSELLLTTSRMAKVGGWGKNLLTGEDEWSEVTREIHEVGPDFVPGMHNSLAFYKEGPSRDTIIEAVTRLTETGEPYDVEVEFITAKGNELWIRTMGRAEFQDGRCVRIFGTFQDITDHRRMEDEFRKQNALIVSLLDNIPDIIFIKDIHGTFLGCNAEFARQVGREKDNIIGKTDYCLHTREEADFFRENDRRIFELGSPRQNEEWISYPDGRKVLLDTLKAPYRDPDGAMLGIIGVCRDITDRKQAEEEIKAINAQLQKANAEKDTLFTVIAHDLKSPLSGLLASTELLAHQPDSFSEKELRLLSTALHISARNTFELLEDLLQWARMSQGGMDFAPTATSLAVLVNQSLSTAQDLAKNKDIAIRRDIPPRLTVLADQPMIKTVIRNILFNSIKFTQRGGEIVITASQSEQQVIVAVQDNGIGMSEQALSSLFSLEKEKRPLGTEGENGTGLGLMLCKQFIEQHGGHIWVQSEPGKGTTVFFTLSAQEIGTPSAAET